VTELPSALTGAITFKIRGAPRTVMMAETDNDIRRCFAVMRVLRPNLKTEDQFLARVRELQSQADWRLIYVESADTPVAVAGFRIYESLEGGKVLYAEDPICLEVHRTKGLFKALVRAMEAIGRQEGCSRLYIQADPKARGTQLFFERIDYALSSYGFRKKLI
jgi:hypothetical protein